MLFEQSLPDYDANVSNCDIVAVRKRKFVNVLGNCERAAVNLGSIFEKLRYPNRV